METIYACPICGEPSDYKWECDNCADPNGGDAEGE